MPNGRKDLRRERGAELKKKYSGVGAQDKTRRNLQWDEAKIKKQTNKKKTQLLVSAKWWRKQDGTAQGDSSTPPGRTGFSAAGKHCLLLGAHLLEMGLDHAFSWSSLPPSVAVVSPTWGRRYRVGPVYMGCIRNGVIEG